jgi:hypothetical protein
MNNLERGKIDLRECVEGDILISVHGHKLKYIRPTINSEYLDHLVQYLEDDKGVPYNENNFGTRTHDGYVFKFKRLDTDHDIVQIIKQN